MLKLRAVYCPALVFVVNQTPLLFFTVSLKGATQLKARPCAPFIPKLPNICITCTSGYLQLLQNVFEGWFVVIEGYHGFPLGS